MLSTLIKYPQKTTIGTIPAGNKAIVKSTFGENELNQSELRKM